MKQALVGVLCLLAIAVYSLVSFMLAVMLIWCMQWLGWIPAWWSPWSS